MLPMLMLSTALAGPDDGPRSGDYFWGVGTVAGLSSAACAVGAGAGVAAATGLDTVPEGVSAALLMTGGAILCPAAVGLMMTGHDGRTLLADSALGLGVGVLTGGAVLGSAALLYIADVEWLAIAGLVLAPISIPAAQGIFIGHRAWERDQASWELSLLPATQHPGLLLTHRF